MFHNRYIGKDFNDVVYRDQVDGEQIVETKLREDVDPREDYNIASVKMVKDAVSGGSGDTPIKDLIPEDASEENKLVTENGDQMKVSAAAFNELNARLTALEIAASGNNIGSVIADSIDTQKLLVGGSDLESRVAAIEAVLTNNNLRTAAAPAASFTKSVSVDNLDLQPEVTETKKTIEDNIMEEK